MSPFPFLDMLGSFLRPRRRRHRGRLELEALEPRNLLAGTWTALTNLAPGAVGTGTMLLLTDGTVMVQGGYDSNAWYKLTPSSSGSYVNGTWTTLPSMSTTRRFFGSSMLPSGKVLVIGGEYSANLPDSNETDTAEIYDPVANTWTSIATYPLNAFGDDPTEVLANGTVLAGDLNGPTPYIYNPATNTWSPAGTKLHDDPSSEEGWLKLPDGSLLSYDISYSEYTGTGIAERYFPATNTWADTGTLPVQLSSYYEMGPSFLLPDGRALLFGDNGDTAYYTPSTNTWTAGPVTPNSLASADAPGAELPNGDVLIAVGSNPHNGGVDSLVFYEFNPIANTYTKVNPTASILDTTGSATDTRMVVLPSGQVLVTSSGNQLAVYTPAGSANSSWLPAISSVVSNGNLTYTLTGTQLNGLSEGAAFGDDAQEATNYPLVELTSGSTVYFARSTGWTSQVATGSTPVTTQFTLPAGIPVGSYNVTVTANGITSASFPFTVTLAETGSTPAAGSIVSTPPTSFVVNFNEAVNSASVTAGDLLVNGIPATGVSLNGAKTKATFTFGTSPVTAEGVQTMAIAAGAITGSDGSVNTAFSAAFNFDALTLAVPSTSPAAGSDISLAAAGSTLTYTITFNKAIDPATVSLANLTLSQGTVTAATVLPGNRAVVYTLANLGDGPLSVSLAAGQVEDAADNPSFTPFAGSYTVDVVALPTLTAVLPAGSLVYGTSVSDTIGFSGDSNTFTLPADPGQTLTLFVTAPLSALQPTLKLTDPSGATLGTASSAGAGQGALLQTVATTTSGTYTISVAGASGTTGSYTLQVELNAAVDGSSQGVGSNATQATAQDLTASFVSLQTSQASGTRAAVLGSVGESSTTLYALDSGTWDSTGYHDNTTANYFAGENGGTLRDFLVFNLSGITQPITSAQVVLANPSNGFYDDRGTSFTDTFGLFDVSTSLASLEADGSGQTAIYNDLGSGTSYGTATVSTASNGANVTVNLSAAAVTALNNARGAPFALGGAITTLTGSDNQYVFYASPASTDVRELVLTFASNTPHYYSFSLASGEVVTATLKNLTGSGDTLFLRNSGGTKVATATAGPFNVDLAITNYVAPSAGTYYLQVSDTTMATTYNLQVTRDPTFDTKTNTTLATAENVTGTQGVLGTLSSTTYAVVPAADASTENGYYETYPFNLSDIGYLSTRYQQIYAAAEFGSGGLIDAIRFRRSAGTAPFTSTPENLSISLAYAATTVATASDIFASNIGTGGLVNVFSGSLVLASTLASSSPEAFDIVIPLMHAFTYNPALGSLLLDLSVYNSPGSGFTLAATGPENTNSTTGIFSSDVTNPPSGTVGFDTASPSPFGVITRFDYATAPPADWYQVTLTSSQNALKVETRTPLGGPNAVFNTLDPNIQLYNASGVLLTSGTLLADNRNQSFLATGLTSGATYYVSVSSANGSSGEYFLGVTPETTLFTSGPPPTSMTAGQTYSFTFTASGSPTPTLSASNLPPWLTFNPATGLLTGTSTVAMTYTNLQITAANSGGSVTTTFNLTVNPGPFGKYVIAIPSGNPVSAGSSFLLTFQAADVYGNPVSSYAGPTSLTLSTSPVDNQGNFVPNPIAALNSSGFGYFFPGILKTAGSYIITATGTQGNNTYLGTANLTVAAGTATHFSVSAPTVAASTPLLTGTTGASESGSTVTLHTTVASGLTLGQVVLVSGVTATGYNGIFTLLSASGTTLTYTATQTLLPNSGGGTVGLFATTGSAFSTTVTALDTYGNPVTGYTGTVKLTSSDNAASFPVNNYTFTTGTGNDNGVHTFCATLNTAGSQTLTATDTTATNPAIIGSSSAIATRGLAVTSYTPTTTGFVITFDKPMNPTALSLYGVGQAAVNPPGLTLTGPGGTVKGTVLLDPTDTTLTFVRSDQLLLSGAATAGELADGSYTLTLSSGQNGFQDTGGNALDGSGNGGTGNYVTHFSTNFQAATVAVTVTDFAVGPGQPVNLGIVSPTGLGIPINISDGDNATIVTFSLTYNPSLLVITGQSPDPGTPGTSTFSRIPGTPLNGLETDVFSFNTHGANLGTGSLVTLGELTANVPSSARNLYKAKALLHISAATDNGTHGILAGVDGVQLNAYFGDTSGNGSYDPSDSALAARVGAGADTGFAAYRLADPVIVGDVHGDGAVSGTDASEIAAFTVGNFASAPYIEALLSPALTITATGPDPALSIPGMVAATGAIVEVPVNIDDPHPAGSTGLTEATLALTYDPRVLSVSPQDIQLGSVPLSGTGWTLTAAVNQETGQIGITLYSLTPISSSAAGSLVIIAFQAYPGVSGVSPVQLVAAVNPTGGAEVRTGLDDAQGGLTLHVQPAAGFVLGLDGLVVVTPPAPSEALAAVGGGSPLPTISEPASLSPTVIPAEEDASGIAALLLAGPAASLVIGVYASPLAAIMPFFPPAIVAVPRLIEQVFGEPVHKLMTSAAPNGLENLLWDATDLNADWLSGRKDLLIARDQSAGPTDPQTGYDSPAVQSEIWEEYFGQVGEELE